MNVLQTSRVIEELQSNEDECRGHAEYAKDLFHNLFDSSRKPAINETELEKVLHVCDVLWKKELFSKFKKPNTNEYFKKEARNMYISNYMSAFFSFTGNPMVSKSVDMRTMLMFFKKIGDFYFFLNYLDVDENILTFFKIMQVLFCLEINDRNVIEQTFQNVIGVLDDFFVNEVLVRIIGINMNNLRSECGICLYAPIVQMNNLRSLEFLIEIGYDVKTEKIESFIKTVDSASLTKTVGALMKICEKTGNLDILKQIVLLMHQSGMEHFFRHVMTSENIELLTKSSHKKFADYINTQRMLYTGISAEFDKVKKSSMFSTQYRKFSRTYEYAGFD